MFRFSGILTLVFLTLAGQAHAVPRPAVSILPQAWFVERIAQPGTEVLVVVGPGHSPATYEPTASQMARLLESDVFFSAGVPFEKGLLPRLEGQQGAPAIHGPRHASGSHHPDLDPHFWLDPRKAAAFADTVALTLMAIDPSGAPEYRRRADQLKADLDGAYGKIRADLAACAGREFFVFHPAFGHFAEAFELVQIAVEDHGHEPGPRHLAETIERAQAAGATAIIVQPQFSRKSATAVAEAVGAELIDLDPLAADYLTNLRHIAGVLAELMDCVHEGGAP